MSQPIKLDFTGLSNTFDRTQVGQRCFDMSNVSLDSNILEAELGYTVQIPELGQTAWGFGFGRFAGIEEYIVVIGSTVYTASPTSTTWTPLRIGVSPTPWEFLQYGDTIYAANAHTGLVLHVIGSSGWVGAEKPVTPPAGGLYGLERFYQSGPAFQQRSIKQYFSGTWLTTGFLSTPTITSSGDYSITFQFNTNYSVGAPKEFRHVLTLPSVNWSNQDFLELEVVLTLNNSPNGVLRDGSLNVSCVASGLLVQPLVGTQIKTSNRQQKRRFYFLGNRAERTSVTQLVIEWGASNSLANNTTFTYNLVLGDTWQNNSNGFLVDDGPFVASRQYAYSTFKTATSAESDLSPALTSPNTPAGGPIVGALGGSYTRIGLTPVSSGLTSLDFLKLYRKRVNDGKWVFVGSIPNSGTPFTGSNPSATCFVDDHYIEAELGGLTEFTQLSNLPLDLDPQVMGRFRGSLALGIGKDLYISKVNKPSEYEDINDAPRQDDFSAGRSVFVDENRSENINMVQGSNVLYLGTRHRTYFMFGDFPKDLSAPRPIDNIGPIGSRSHSLFETGVVVLNQEGLWGIKYNDLTGAAIGDLVSEELSKDIRNSISSLNPNSSSVVTVHRGELLAFQANKYLRLSRRGKHFTQGSLNHEVVAAIPDYSQNLRLLTKLGGLLKYGSSTTYNGSAVNWNYTTGDVIVPRTNISSIQVIATGSPTLTVTSFDGQYGSKSKTYTIDSGYYSIKDLSGSYSYGTRFRFSFSGNQNDKVFDCTLKFAKQDDDGAR